MIPKIIHYCWFGGEELPSEYREYITEWQTLHPAWEIIRWDEYNAPLDFDYLNKALAGGFYSNMSNFMRLYSLKEFGGIYLDTDVKLIHSLERLLNDKCFFGFEDGGGNTDSFWVNNAICGAEKGHEFIKSCFDGLLYLYDGTEQSNLSGPQLTTKQLIDNRGLKHYGMQKLHDVTLYPKEFFYPIPWYLAKDTRNYEDFISSETIAVHMWGRSWFTKEMMLNMIDDLQKWSSDQSKYISDLKNGLEYEQAQVKTLEEQNQRKKLKIDELLQLIQNHEEAMAQYKLDSQELASENKGLSETQQELSKYLEKLNGSISSIISFNKSLIDSQYSSFTFADSINQQLISLQAANNTLPDFHEKVFHATEQILNATSSSNQRIVKLAEENAELQNSLQEANNKIALLENKIEEVATHTDSMLNQLQASITISNDLLLKKIDENKFLVGNVIHHLNEAYNKQKTTIDTLTQTLQEKQEELDACTRQLNKTWNSLSQQEVAIKWYQKTYEQRSLIGILKEKIFTGNRSH